MPVAIVSGGGNGIGAAVVARLLAADYRVAALDLKFSPTDDDGESQLQITCDVSSENDVNSAVDSVVGKWGGIDALFCIAGVLAFEHASETSSTLWRRLIDINLGGTFTLCRSALEHLVRSKGCIVTTGSTAALCGLAYGSAYAASKGGGACLYPLSRA